LRKKWLVLTPEEWVRQHAVQYLIQQKGYSSGLIHLEKGLKVNGLSKRADIVCYNRKMEPQLLVECKAPEIKLSQATFDQAARYNMTLRVPLLMITNGIEIVRIVFWKKCQLELIRVNSIPRTTFLCQNFTDQPNQRHANHCIQKDIEQSNVPSTIAKKLNRF
jgi:hypothetical protein